MREGYANEQDRIAEALCGRVMELSVNPKGSRLICRTFADLLDAEMKDVLRAEILESEENIRKCSEDENGKYVLAKVAEFATKDQLAAIDTFTE
jgi:hypothetical protein